MKKNKITKNNGLAGRIKVLLSLLVLSGGLLAGVKIVQMSQDSRSSAATLEYISGQVTPNSKECKSAGGLCAYFTRIYADGYGCKVRGTLGYLKSGLCPGEFSNICCIVERRCSNHYCSICKDYSTCMANSYCKWGYNGLSTLNCSNR